MRDLYLADGMRVATGEQKLLHQSRTLRAPLHDGAGSENTDNGLGDIDPHGDAAAG